MTDAYPLAWPDGWPRTPLHLRPIGRGNFMRGAGGARYAWTLAEARDELLRTLRGFKADHVVLSSNLPLGRDGLMVEGRRRPEDQGVALYFRRKGQSWAMAYDQWKDVESNLRSLALAIDAMRQLERHGGGALAGRAFSGFLALPPPPSCWQVLGLPPGADADQVRRAFRDRARAAHPDGGGSHAAMAELTAARDAALRLLESRP